MTPVGREKGPEVGDGPRLTTSRNDIASHRIASPSTRVCLFHWLDNVPRRVLRLVNLMSQCMFCRPSRNSLSNRLRPCVAASLLTRSPTTGKLPREYMRMPMYAARLGRITRAMHVLQGTRVSTLSNPHPFSRRGAINCMISQTPTYSPLTFRFVSTQCPRTR